MFCGVDAYDNTWKCSELKLYFSPSAGGLKKKKSTWDYIDRDINTLI